jgi:hypothetical protein
MVFEKEIILDDVVDGDHRFLLWPNIQIQIWDSTLQTWSRSSCRVWPRELILTSEYFRGSMDWLFDSIKSRSESPRYLEGLSLNTDGHLRVLVVLWRCMQMIWELSGYTANLVGTTGCHNVPIPDSRDRFPWQSAMTLKVLLITDDSFPPRHDYVMEIGSYRILRCVSLTIVQFLEINVLSGSHLVFTHIILCWSAEAILAGTHEK